MNVSPSEVPALLNSALQRLGAQSAACKLWSVLLTTGLLVFLAERGGGGAALAWAAAPALLLGLADAVYKAQAGRIAAMAGMKDLRPEDLFRVQAGSGGGIATAVRSLGGLASFSVWPFYLALAAMVLVLGQSGLLTPGPGRPVLPTGVYPPNTPRPAYTVQQGTSLAASGAGSAAYPAGVAQAQVQGQGQPSQVAPNPVTMTRPNLPPMGVPGPRPNAPGPNLRAPAMTGGAPPPPANLSRAAPSTAAGASGAATPPRAPLQPPKAAPAPSAAPAAAQTQAPFPASPTAPAP